MKKRLLGIVLIFIVEAMLVSCNLFCSCGCESGPPKQIDIISWNMQTVTDNYQQVDINTELPYNQVYKLLTIDKRNLVINERPSFSSSYNAVYACSPAPMKATQSFKSIRIISASEAAYLNSNDLIKIGDDITHRFLISFLFDNDFRPIDDFINQLIIYDEDRFRFRLKEKPFQTTTLKLDFSITMSDGKVFEFKNELLTIN